MIDLNTLLTAALQQVLQDLLKPYEERISALETQLLSITSLTEDDVRTIAQEVCNDEIAEHNQEFDHEPLTDLSATIRDEVEVSTCLYQEASRNLACRSVRNHQLVS